MLGKRGQARGDDDDDEEYILLTDCGLSSGGDLTRHRKRDSSTRGEEGSYSPNGSPRQKKKDEVTRRQQPFLSLMAIVAHGECSRRFPSTVANSQERAGRRFLGCLIEQMSATPMSANGATWNMSVLMGRLSESNRRPNGDD